MKSNFHEEVKANERTSFLKFLDKHSANNSL
jgi:hypothetical protein